jgi:phosphopantothenoylcysteine synthetase/decarboxylase
MDFLEKVKDRYLTQEYSNFNEYADTMMNYLQTHQPDIVVLAAAVSDYAPVKSKGKISSDLDKMVIELEQTPKLIRMIRTLCPETFLVGFKLLVGSTAEELEGAMRKQMEKAKTDMVVGNDLRDIRANKHSLTVLREGGHFCKFEGMPGASLADSLVEAITVVSERKWRQ